jgi:hypothetical protein
VYLVPVALVGTSECRLRVEPSRNNQRRRINLADDFRIERWTDEAIRGAVDKAIGQQQIAMAP